MSNCPSCSAVECPDPVATINHDENTVTVPDLEITVTDAAPSFTVTVDIDVGEAGYWLLNCWFTDTAAPTHNDSMTPPSNPGVSQFQKVTAADGTSSFSVAHDSAKTVYLHVALNGAIFTSAVINLAV